MIYSALAKLIDYATKCNLVEHCDLFVIKNQLMDILKLSDWTHEDGTWNGESIDELLDPIIEYAIAEGIISDTTNSRDLFDTKVMGIFTAMPREVFAKFKCEYKSSPEAATDWYFDFCKKLNYVRETRIAKDLKWTYKCEYGTLDITINRSKPEKDPRDIVAAKTSKNVAYPKCQLCAENAGFAGHATHPARQNLRPVPINVAGEPWQFQYSPYGYYNEHCIVFNELHVPMKIDESVFGKLFDIVDYLPHYFVGSNADLPIVGGSILSHEHFQGGKYTFAMEKAPVEKEFEFSEFPFVKAGRVKWPMSVIRLSSEDKNELSRACNHVLLKWRSYSDPKVNIFSETNGEPHNTVTPIARKKNGIYECDLVLRNNLTTDERPLGLFHPAPELHHIKKENIGLIEVMGLAVLPARLAHEIVELENTMLNGMRFDTPSLKSHEEWAKKVLDAHPEFCSANAREILEFEIGKVFLDVLLDAGVYKRTPDGIDAFDRFISTL